MRIHFFDWLHFTYFCTPKMVAVAQLVRASDCDSEGRGFEPHHPPKFNQVNNLSILCLEIFSGNIKNTFHSNRSFYCKSFTISHIDHSSHFNGSAVQ